MMTPPRTFALVLTLGIACGGQSQAPASPEPGVERAAGPPPPAPSAEAAPSTEPATAEAAPTEDAVAAEADANPEADAAEPTARDVKYIVSPDGMRVKVAGVVFTPTAEAVKVAGGWGVRVTVEAKSDDETTHSLLAPKAAELAFAGKILRDRSAEPEAFSDRRAGDRELEVTPNKAVKLERVWPPPGGPKPLAMGDALELQVGIWGLGADASSRRPVGKLCRVEVKLSWEQLRVKVTPPAGVSK